MLGSFGWRKDIEPETDYRIGIEADYKFNNYQNKLDKKSIQKDEIKLSSLAEQLEENREELNLKITELFLALKNYEEKIKFYKKRIRRARERVELAETKYKAGRTTISNLLEKELDLRQQQIEQLSAIVDYNKQVYQLRNLIE